MRGISMKECGGKRGALPSPQLPSTALDGCKPYELVYKVFRIPCTFVLRT